MARRYRLSRQILSYNICGATIHIYNDQHFLFALEKCIIHKISDIVEVEVGEGAVTCAGANSGKTILTTSGKTIFWYF